MVGRVGLLLTGLALGAAAPAVARQVKPIDQLAFPPGTQLRVEGVDLAFSPGFEEVRARLDEMAARTRAADGLPPVDADTYASPEAADRYATLPFKQMFPFELRQKIRDWGLTSGRSVRLRVTFDRMKTADVVTAWLVESADILDGRVEVIDSGTLAPLGSFRVNVVNANSGLAGMAIRGWGVREKLADEFSLETARFLAGRDRADSDS